MGIRLEEILSNGKYCKKDTEFGGNNDEVVWTNSGPNTEDEKVYTYDEAIDLTGSGWYNIGLMMTLSLAVQGMCMDMFGFSYVVAAAACDLNLSHHQTSFLLSVPLMGAVISAYVHGYLSDIRGRKKCLSICLWSSFIIASMSAFSTNFTVLAILRLFSSSICSGVQSMSYTMMGECCSVRTKQTFVLLLNSSLMCVLAVFTAHAYFVLGLDFTYDLGFIIFKPWRLLILTLALGLGSSALLMQLFHESPKYLVNAGRIDEAIEILRKIKKKNGEKGFYPVKKIVLVEENSVENKDVSFLRSLWDQIAPLFIPPLLQRTLTLFYILAVIYSVNNGFYVWIPILFSSFFEEPTMPYANATENFCQLINLHPDESNDDCSSQVSLETLLMSIIQGLVFVTINYGVARLPFRKKAAIMFFCMLASASCVAMVFINEKITTVIFFFSVQLSGISIGMIFCYMIDLYPTRFRGMITALAVMVARGSGMVGVFLVGRYTFSNCVTSLYSWGAYAFSGALVALLLPSDVPKKS